MNIIEYIPTILTALLGAIATAAGKKLVEKVNEIKKNNLDLVQHLSTTIENKDNSELEELKQLVNQLTKNSIEVNQKYNKLIESLTHIEVQDDKNGTVKKD